ncbi:polysaccharide deacetylase family protein [Shewanella sp. UCD-KL12]|uniref:polysaccharide deacetylase family protein n=1 Tax=Shewanella sp. UCD-KL12 TaxID=1917163 RepID=UPI0009707764|nr:polysaccharide deacetylase family protein [Shewanella sp. UCD-KL12]
MRLISAKTKFKTNTMTYRVLKSWLPLFFAVIGSVLLVSACGGSDSTAQSSDNSAPIDSGHSADEQISRANLAINGIEYQPILDELALPTYWLAASEPSEEILSALKAQLTGLSELFSSQFSVEDFALSISLDPLQTQAIVIDYSSSQIGMSRVQLTLSAMPDTDKLTQPLATAIYLSLRQAHQVQGDLLEKLVSHGLALQFIATQVKPDHLYQATQISTSELADALTLTKAAIDAGGTVADWFNPQDSGLNVLGSDFKDNGAAWKLGHYLAAEHFARYPGSDASNAFAVDANLFKVSLDSSIAVSHKAEQYVRTDDVNQQVAVSELTRQASDFIGAYFLEGWNQEKLIALTFDDGPSPYTTQILDRLAEHQVPASFFWTGENMKSNQAIMARALAEGHTLANHSWSHPYGRSLTNEVLWQQQVLKTNALFQSSVGITPRFYRPPFGEITDEQIAFLDEKGMKVILWSVDTRDWNSPTVTTENISDVMINNLHPEVINLMHDAGGNRQNTVDALPTVIEYYRSQGYRFVNLEQMLGISDKR